MRFLHLLIWAVLCVAVPRPDGARAQVVLAERGQSAALVCDSRGALIRGDGNRITLSGACRALRIDGNRNVVFVELSRGATVRIDGDYNQVSYAPPGPPPVTTLRGYYNDVRPGSTMATPGSLVLDGTSGQHDFACDGLDVVIRDSKARYVLHGGCRSVTVQGRNVTVAAELLPAARLVIGGLGVVINYVLVSPGPPPAVTVTAPGAQATHLARFGETVLTLPTGTAAP